MDHQVWRGVWTNEILVNRVKLRYYCSKCCLVSVWSHIGIISALGLKILNHYWLDRIMPILLVPVLWTIAIVPILLVVVSNGLTNHPLYSHQRCHLATCPVSVPLPLLSFDRVDRHSICRLLYLCKRNITKLCTIVIDENTTKYNEFCLLVVLTHYPENLPRP